MVEITTWLYLLGGIAIFLIAIILLITPKSSKIEKTVRAMYEQNKSIEEVLAYGKTKKWNEREIKLYYLLFTMLAFKEKNYSLDEIKSMAQDAQWPQDMIEIVIRKLK